MMASAQVVETSVNTSNSPSQEYTTNPDDHQNHNVVALIYFPLYCQGFSSLTVLLFAHSLTRSCGSLK